MSKLVYERLGILGLSGTTLNLNIDASKLSLEATDFIQDSYVISMKPGIVVTMGSEGYLKPAGGSNDEVPLGFLINDAAGYANQNMDARASGMSAVLVGNGNMIVTDNVKETDIKCGAKLYVGADGVLTKTEGTLKGAVAVALSENSATNKAVILQTLI